MSRSRYCCGGRVLPISRLGVVVVAVTLGWGCGSKKKQAAPADERAVSEDAAPAAKVVPAAAAGPVLTPAVVEQLVTRWAAVQNAGDFAGYEALYAAEMQGVLRVGGKSRVLDRAGWMKSRERMFKRGFELEVENVEVEVTGSTGSARFIQTFTAKKFRDRGPKVLSIALVNGEARIVEEKMLESVVDSNGPLAPGQAIERIPKAVRKLLAEKVGDAKFSFGITQPLGGGATGMALLFESEPEEESDDRVRTEEEILTEVYPEIEVGSASFVLVEKSADGYEIRDIATAETDGSMGLTELGNFDVDGDGLRDTLLATASLINGTNYSFEHLVVFSSRDKTVTAELIGMEKSHGVDSHSIEVIGCFCRVDGTSFLVTFTNDVTMGDEGSGEDTTILEVEILGGAEQSLFGVIVSGEAKDERLREISGDPKASAAGFRAKRATAQCPGGDKPALVADWGHGRSIVTALSTTAAGAKKAAAARGLSGKLIELSNPPPPPPPY